jgi:hypothetical protein
MRSALLGLAIGLVLADSSVVTLALPTDSRSSATDTTRNRLRRRESGVLRSKVSALSTGPRPPDPSGRSRKPPRRTSKPRKFSRDSSFAKTTRSWRTSSGSTTLRTRSKPPTSVVKTRFKSDCALSSQESQMPTTVERDAEASKLRSNARGTSLRTPLLHNLLPRSTWSPTWLTTKHDASG